VAGLVCTLKAHFEVAENEDNREYETGRRQQQHNIGKEVEACFAGHVYKLQSPEDGCGKKNNAQNKVGNPMLVISLRSKYDQRGECPVIDIATHKKTNEEPREREPDIKYIGRGNQLSE